MDSSSIASENEWTVVSNKRGGKASSTYVPPNLRKTTENTVPVAKVCNLNSAEDFPSLVSVSKKTPTTAWGNKTSFSQKIQDLIALEQRSEVEKAEAAEAAKELEGYAVLSLKFTKERYIAFNESMAAAEKEVEHLDDVYSRQMYAYTAKETDPYNNDVYNDNDDDEDNSSVEMED